MNHQSRRYIFIDFENLKKVKFKKLERVCDKVFIFIDNKEESVPLSLVRQMQKMGRSIKWVSVDNLKEIGVNYHISFLMGKLHERVNYDIEFAVLSNDETFDPLVNFINNEGRSCVRVKRKASMNEREEEDDMPFTPNIYVPVSQPATQAATQSTNNAASHLSVVSNVSATMSSDNNDETFVMANELDDELIEETARETIKRLIRSGNRPAEVSTLRNYILLHNQELSLHGNLDKIIRRMERSKEIEIQGQEVVYNF